MLRFVISASLVLTTMCVTGWQKVSAEEPHAHATKGPHKGSLIELGEEEYHAEIVHDEEMGRVTIFLLGSDAKTVVATDAKEVAINAKVKGKAVQMKLKAAPQKGDKAGTSSRFASTSEELMELLDDHDVKPILRVAIAGKTFNGKIEHDHDDEEHAKEKPAAPKKK